MDETKKISFSMHSQDLAIIDSHNKEMADPGRSAALRHIIREWVAMRVALGSVPMVGKVSADGTIQFDGDKQE